jgi:hypothetical protein
MINKNSFAETIDRINEAYFFGKKITQSEKKESAKWIAGRQGLPGAYRGMFAPTKADHTNGIRVFTGEWITSNAAIRHILSEEASRVLLQMNVKDDVVTKAYKLSKQSLLNSLLEGYPRGREAGFYCCGKCSAALWRHFTAGGFDNAEVRLENGLHYLKLLRTGDGKWRRFPFYYTILALSDITLPAALEELRYTAPVMERSLRYLNRRDKYSKRKKVLLERMLEKV